MRANEGNGENPSNHDPLAENSESRTTLATLAAMPKIPFHGAAKFRSRLNCRMLWPETRSVMGTVRKVCAAPCTHPWRHVHSVPSEPNPAHKVANSGPRKLCVLMRRLDRKDCAAKLALLKIRPLNSQVLLPPALPPESALPADWECRFWSQQDTGENTGDSGQQTVVIKHNGIGH
jgi:hypothetical protein